MAGYRDPKAFAAHLGRSKYGASKFQEMAAAGRSRAAEARGKGEKPTKTWKPGGGKRFAKMVEAARSGSMSKVGRLMKARTAKQARAA